jgi:hypothetical protein
MFRSSSSRPAAAEPLSVEQHGYEPTWDGRPPKAAFVQRQLAGGSEKKATTGIEPVWTALQAAA